MPRAKKTPLGAPAQKIQAVPGQTYGEGVRQEALQKAMPAPNVPGPTAPTGQVQAPRQSAQQAVSPEQRQQQNFARIVEALRGSGGMLRQPDDRPKSPVTAGLPIGPGPGPEVLGQGNRMGNTLRRLAIQTNDPLFAELASKIGL